MLLENTVVDGRGLEKKSYAGLGKPVNRLYKVGEGSCISSNFLYEETV